MMFRFAQDPGPRDRYRGRQAAKALARRASQRRRLLDLLLCQSVRLGGEYELNLHVTIWGLTYSRPLGTLSN